MQIGFIYMRLDIKLDLQAYQFPYLTFNNIFKKSAFHISFPSLTELQQTLVCIMAKNISKNQLMPTKNDFAESWRGFI